MVTPYSSDVPDARSSTIFFNCLRPDGRSSFGVRDGNFVPATGEFDRRIDLAGAHVLPAFGDGHTHPLFAGRELVGPKITGLTDIKSIVRAVRDFADANPKKEWIVGGTYDRTLGDNGTFDAAWLDAGVADRPVVLHARDHHTIWVNSEAMRRAGVTSSTPDCENGIIVRFSNGEPRGTFREWEATNLILSQVPARSLEDEIDSLAEASVQMAAAGVTWWQDAWIDPGMAEIYLETSRRGRLIQDVDLAYRADPNTWQKDFEYFIAMREQIQNSKFANRLTSRTIKFFTDGVIEGGTALLLDPYVDDPHSHGMSVWPRDELMAAALVADNAGFQLHIHAIGDGGVRLALDVIENIITTNPPRARRPVIAHVQLITEEDLPRVAALGVIANFTPIWTCLDQEQDVLCTPRIGQARSDSQYRMRSLLDSGARISFGSDWPVTTHVPFAGLPTAVHRRSTAGYPPEGWLMHEAVTMDEALAAYTSGVAYQAFQETEWGGLDEGLAANFLIVDKDPRQIPIDQVATVQIQATYLRGEPVFERR